jgi:hypothetical protein
MHMREHRWVVVAVLAGAIVAGASTRAQTPPTPQTAPQVPAAAQPAPAPVPADYTFVSGAGLLFYYVKPANVTEFEAVVSKLREALGKADSPQRKQQALNWRIYKSAEAVTTEAIYVFAFDPALAAASYDPLALIAEVLPADAQPLYEKLKGAIIKVERMGLTKIR